MAKKSDKSWDLVIVGAGPAGLCAATYSARYGLKTLVLGKLPGGTISEAYEVCNFPGYDKIKGYELAGKMIGQAKNVGAEVRYEEVVDIKKSKLFELKTNAGEYEAKKIIIASGTERRKLGIKGEKDFLGRGVSYCATCDAALYRGKVAAVAGGSNAAATAALLLAEHAKKVYLIFRKKEMTAEKAWADLVKKNKRIEIVPEKNVIEIYGKDRVEGLKLDNGGRLGVDGIFIEAGSVPNKKLAEILGLKMDGDYVATDTKQATSLGGVFAAGDATNNSFKQAVTACAEGAVAANSVYEELKKEEN